jgi:hypothetical protein
VIKPFHPVLTRLFTRLERQGLTWLLLWVPTAPDAPTGDVDLLADPSDAPAIRAAAEELGFVALPGWGSGRELILVTYDAASDRWLVVEVVTEISYRSTGWTFPEPAVEAVLRRRRTRHEVALAADGDAFWLLLLHCLLDKGWIREAYRARLRGLARSGLKSPLGSAACAAAGGALDPADLVAAAEAGRWPTLVELGTVLAEGLRRGVSLRARRDLFARRLIAAIRKPLLVRRRRGPNIALLGPNGVGKSTAAHTIQRSYPFESRLLYMGVWKAADRDRGGPGRFAEVATRPARIWGRYCLAQYHQLRGRLVIFDRYVYEALLPAEPPFAPLKRVYFWMLVHLIPSPTAGLVLDVPGEIAFGRKQENPPAELEFERRVYTAAAARVPSLQLVDANRSPAAVCAEINSVIWRELRERWR